MTRISSNAELYEYMLGLASELKTRGCNELAEILNEAAKHAAGMITEFLGESRLALRRILLEGGGALRRQEQEDVSDVLRQLDSVLDHR